MQQLLQSIGLGSIAIAVIAMTPTLFSGPALADDMYGAIASDEQSHWGYGYNFPTQAQAEADALRQCGTDSCVVRVWFKNACGAVVENNTTIGWGWGGSRSEAEAQALSVCGTGSCKVLTWACTDR
jgi:hypothetical protein